ncbi:hypothetical protein H5410_033984 [Solanum commersonii]|uniref:60S ribosomal protein L13 n=1 Tax=Solanum commersonii TaxID=4109 RepID=A0A9J5YUQ3_SOLCO|nr:hypothetical protein H5410_033984 [Solanum commersonii]
MKHNNVIPYGHFKKHTDIRVKTWFNQPARKKRRRIARKEMAVKIPPPTTAGALHPVVHGQTLKYNMKVRSGRGFSLEELQAAGIPKKLVSTNGIVVDHPCRNRLLEGIQADVLKTYKANSLVVLIKVGDSALSRDWLQQLKFMEPTCLLRVRSRL